MKCCNFILIVGVVFFSSCQMQKRVTIPSGGRLVAQAPVIKNEMKDVPVVTPVVKEDSKVVTSTERVEYVKPVEVAKPQVPVEVVTPPSQPAPVTPKVEVKVRQESFTAVDKKDEARAQKHYHVVVGSFGKQDNATRLRSLLASQGYTPIVVVNEAGMYRVIIISCETYDEAHKVANVVRANYPDAWILSQK